MGRSLIETLIGIVATVVVGVAVYFAYTASDVRAVRGYELQARFASAAGLATGIDVKMSGVKIGAITDLRLDPATRRPVVRFMIAPELRIPVDSLAVVASDGLLGGNFISIEPGRSPDRLKPGEEIKRTEEPIDVTKLLGEVVARAMKYSADDAAAAGAKAPK